MLNLKKHYKIIIIPTILGGLSVLGFSPFYLYPVPIVCLAILIYLCEESNKFKLRITAGFCFGLGLFLTGTSWIFISLTRFGGMNELLAGFVIFIFSSYLAFFSAIACGTLYFFKQLNQKVKLLFVSPALWVIGEMSRGYFFSGFPWLSIGYSQVPNSPLTGFAPVGGIYLVSFVCLICSGALMLTFKNLRFLNQEGNWAVTPITIILISLLGFQLSHVKWSKPVTNRPVSVALIQGNIAQDQKWNPREVQNTLLKYKKLAHATNADLVFLPETAFPIFDDFIEPTFLDNFSQLFKESGRDALVGLPEITPEGKKFNTVRSFGSNPSQNYRKIHLVPFGDYFPLKSVFGWFINNVNIPMSSFSKGSVKQSPFNLSGQKIAINICYEDVFGEEIAENLPEATILANFTNDAWWGRSLASRQHLQISQMRAIETARPMLRVTNTGVTAVINWRGEITAKLPEFTDGVLKGEVVGRQGITPFVIVRNNIALIISVSIIVIGIYKTRKKR